MDIFVLVIKTLGLGILISIPGIFIGRLLAAKGIAPDQSRTVTLANILGLLLAQLVVSSVPLVYIATALLFLSPLGVYRHDLWTTFRNGK